MSSTNLPVNISGQVLTVPDFASLPPAALVPIGSERVTEDSGILYINSGAAWTASGGGGGGVASAANVGGGAGVFKTLSGGGTIIDLKTLTSTGGSVILTPAVSTIDLSVNGVATAGSNTIAKRDGFGQLVATGFTGGDLNGNALNVTGVVAIANGGTGQSNAQAGLNNLTDVGSSTDGDVLQSSGGNALFAPLNLGLSSNTFLFSDAASKVVSYTNWQIDPTTFFSNVDNFLRPNNLGSNVTAYGWNINVAPLQNSPNDSLTLQNLSVGLDTSAAGFSFGDNGQAANLQNGGYNYGGNGATFGFLRHVNMFSSFGNGTDPGTFKGLGASSHGFNIGENITLDGTVKGYEFNLTVDAAALSTANFNVLLISDFSQIPIDTYGYQGVVLQPNIATIKNGHNFNAITISPTIGVMEGNAGFFGHEISGSITTLGTGGFAGYNVNTAITTIPATANYIGYSCFSQIGTMAATSSFQGNVISPTITALHANADMYQSFPQIAGGDGQVTLFNGGMNNVHTTGDTSVLNLNGQTADGRMSSFNIDGVRTNIGGTLTAASGQGVQSQHVIFTSYTQNGVGAVTGTDVLCNILSPDVDFGAITDSLALGPSGLGFNMVGFAGQMHGHGSMALCNSLLSGAIFAEDFTVTDYNCVNAVLINAGYTGAATNVTAFYHEVTGAGLFATNHFGVRIVSDIDNYTTKFKMGDGSQKADPLAVLDLESTTKGVLLPRMTTVQKLALVSPPEGLEVYDVTLHQKSYFNGTVWVNI